MPPDSRVVPSFEPDTSSACFSPEADALESPRDIVRGTADRLRSGEIREASEPEPAQEQIRQEWRDLLESSDRSNLDDVQAAADRAFDLNGIRLDFRPGHLDVASCTRTCERILAAGTDLVTVAQGLHNSLDAVAEQSKSPAHAGRLLRSSHLGKTVTWGRRLVKHMFLSASHNWTRDDYPELFRYIQPLKDLSKRLEELERDLFALPLAHQTSFRPENQKWLEAGTHGYFRGIIRRLRRLPPNELRVEPERLFESLNQSVHRKDEYTGRHVEQVGLASAILTREWALQLAVEHPNDFLHFVISSFHQAGYFNLEQLRNGLEALCTAYTSELTLKYRKINSPAWETSPDGLAAARASMREEQRLAAEKRDAYETFITPQIPRHLEAKWMRRVNRLKELDHELGIAAKRDVPALLEERTKCREEEREYASYCRQANAPGFRPFMLDSKQLLDLFPQYVLFWERERENRRILSELESDDPATRGAALAKVRQRAMDQARRELLGSSKVPGSFAERAYEASKTVLDPILRSVVRGGILHDLGKIGLPTAFLNGSQKLTENDRRTMGKHTRYGAYVLEPICDDDPLILAIPENHHTHFDDSSRRNQTTRYPQSMQQRDIPAAARAGSIADAASAIGDKRPFRDVQGEEDLEHITDRQVAELTFCSRERNYDSAIGEIGKGMQFDPAMAPLYVEHMLEVKNYSAKQVLEETRKITKKPEAGRNFDIGMLTTLHRMNLVRNPDKALHSLLASLVSEHLSRRIKEHPKHELHTKVSEEAAMFGTDVATWQTSVELALQNSELGFIGLHEDIDDQHKTPDHPGYKDDREDHIAKSIELLGVLGSHRWLMLVQTIIAYHHASADVRSFIPSREFIAGRGETGRHLAAFLDEAGVVLPTFASQVHFDAMTASVLRAEAEQRLPRGSLQAKPLCGLLGAEGLILPARVCELPLAEILQGVENAGPAGWTKGLSLVDVLERTGLLTPEDILVHRTGPPFIPLAARLTQVISALTHRVTDDGLPPELAGSRMELMNAAHFRRYGTYKWDQQLLHEICRLLDRDEAFVALLSRGLPQFTWGGFHEYDLNVHMAKASAACEAGTAVIRDDEHDEVRVIDSLAQRHQRWLEAVERQGDIKPKDTRFLADQLRRIDGEVTPALVLSPDVLDAIEARENARRSAGFWHDAGKLEARNFAFIVGRNLQAVRNHRPQRTGTRHDRAGVRLLGDMWTEKRDVPREGMTGASPKLERTTGQLSTTTKPVMKEANVDTFYRTVLRNLETSRAHPTRMVEYHRRIVSLVGVHQLPLDLLRWVQESCDEMLTSALPQYEKCGEKTLRLEKAPLEWARMLLRSLFEGQLSLPKDVESIPDEIRQGSQKILDGAREKFSSAVRTLVGIEQWLREPVALYDVTRNALAETVILERDHGPRTKIYTASQAKKHGLPPPPQTPALPPGETPFIDDALAVWLADFSSKKDDVEERYDAGDYVLICSALFSAARERALERSSNPDRSSTVVPVASSKVRI